MRRTLVVAASVVVVLLVAGTVAAQTAGRFSDVPTDHEAVAAINWAADVGLTQGYGDGTFRPDTPLSKDHAVIFMERFYDNILQASESESFTRADMMQLLHTISGATDTVVDTAACDVLRRTAAQTFSGSPVEQIDVTVVTVALDDLSAPTDGYIPAAGTVRDHGFIDEVLAALEVKLEALTHGRTDWVFHDGGEVDLPVSVHSHIIRRDAATDELVLIHGGATAVQLASRYPDDRVLAFAAGLREFPYRDLTLDNISVVRVGPEPEPEADSAYPDIRMYQRARTRFSQAVSASAFELLRQLGLDNLRTSRPDDGTERADSGSGESSMMGLSSYGWGQGSITDSISRPGWSWSLTYPTAEHPHEPFTGWNKWLFGWLDSPSEAICVSTAELSTVTVRPHQRTAIGDIGLTEWPDHACWGGWTTLKAGPWGSATKDPAIAIIPVSDTTAVVIEADPWAVHRPAGIPQCFIGELPHSPTQCRAPRDHQPQSGDVGERSQRYVGDIIVYDVDLTTGLGAQLLTHPTVAVVSPDTYRLEAAVFGATGAVGRHYAPGGQYADVSSRGPWTDGLPVECYFVSEVTVHGYRIAVQDATTTDGSHEVTVTIQPPE